MAAFIGGQTDEIVFTKNGTEAINLVATRSAMPEHPVQSTGGAEVAADYRSVPATRS